MSHGSAIILKLRSTESAPIAAMSDELTALSLVYRAVVKSNLKPSTPITSIHQRSESMIWRTECGLLAANVFPQPVTST